MDLKAPIPDFIDRLQRLACVGAWSLDLQTNAVWWSDEMYRIHDLTPGDAIDFDKAVSFYDPATRTMMRGLVEHAIRDGKPLSMEEPMVTAKGRKIWVHASAERIERGGGLMLLGTFQDVTAAVELKARLEEASVFLESVFNNIPHMVFVKEAKELRFVRFNRAGEELLGVRNEDIIGKNDFDFFPPDQALHFTSKDREALDRTTATNIPEEPIDTPAGQRFLNTKKIPVRDRDGVVRYLLGISEDVTEQRAGRELLEQQQRALLFSSKMSALGEMASSLAHEINNPLAIIDGLTRKLQILQAKGTATPEVSSDLTMRIIATVERIGRIIKNLRGFARDGDHDPFETVDLGKVAAETLSLCQEKLKNHDVRLDFGAVPKAAIVTGRPTQIAQVILNLLNNAFDAVQHLSVKWIDLSIVVEGERVAIRVTDSGGGILPSVRDQLMQPFFTTKAPGQGTGLGLSISKNIAEAHGGRLYLDDKFGHTRFVLELPLKASKAASLPAAG